MSASVTQLFVEASHLDEGDRAALAGLLLESLDQEPSFGVEAAWAEEIERRVRELDSGEVETVPWEEVKNRLLAASPTLLKRGLPIWRERGAIFFLSSRLAWCIAWLERPSR